METSIELTGETKKKFGVVLHRVRATRDIPRRNVKRGDLGGWVESLTLRDGEPRVSPSAWVADDAAVHGNAVLRNNAIISGEAEARDNAILLGHALVSELAQVYGNAIISRNAQIRGRARIFGDARVDDNAVVKGSAFIHGDAIIFREAYIAGQVVIRGCPQIGGESLITSNEHSLHVSGISREFNCVTLNREIGVAVVQHGNRRRHTIGEFERSLRAAGDASPKQIQHLIGLFRATAATWGQHV